MSTEPTTDRAATMRHEIMLTVKANGLPVSGEFWLTLAFRTETELAAICRELHIAVPPKP